MANLAIANSNYSTNSLSSSLESRPLKMLASVTKIALNALGGLATVLAAKTLIGLSLIGSVVIIKIITTTFLAATITLFPTLPILALAVATIAAAVAIAFFASLNFTISLNIFTVVILCLDSLSENISKEKFFIDHGYYPLPLPIFQWERGNIPLLKVNASLDGATSKEITLSDLEEWKETHPRIPFLVEWTPTQQDFPLVIPFLKIYGNRMKKLDLSQIHYSPDSVNFFPDLENILMSLKNLESLSLPSFEGNFSEKFMDFLSRIKDVKCNEHQNQFVKVKLLFSTAKHQNISYNENNRIANFSLNQNTINFLDGLDKSNTLSLFSTAIEKIKNEDVFNAFLYTFSVFLTDDYFKTTFLQNINQSQEINKRSIIETLKKITSQCTFPSEENKEMFYLITDSFPEEHDIENSLKKMISDRHKTFVFDLFFDFEKKEGPLFEFFNSKPGKVFLHYHYYRGFLNSSNIKLFITTHFADNPRFYLACYDRNKSNIIVSCHYDFPEKYPEKALKLFLMAHIKNATLYIKYNNQKGAGIGVTRDFLTRMYEAISKEYHNWNTKNLRYLGLAWKFIILDPARTQTGVVFESLLFERLCKLNYIDIVNDFDLNELKTIQILLSLISKNTYLFTYLEKIKRVMEIDPSKISEEDNAAYEAIRILYKEIVIKDFLAIPTNPQEHSKFIEKFTAKILKIPTNPVRILLEIALGLIQTLGEEEQWNSEDWNSMISSGHEELSALIQGVFNKETFINSISFNDNDSELHNRIKEWIRDWTIKRNDEEVKRLLFYITGSTVCSEIYINIIGKDAHPSTHTCHKIMNLPNNITKEALMKQFDEWVSDKKCHMHVI